MRLRVTFVSCAILLVFAACNEIPVTDLNESYSVQVQVLRDKGKPAKLDVLWVVDDSTSMCQEQQSLADSFKAFLNVFQQYTAIDMRLAVTTTNVCPRDAAGRIRGDFFYRPNTSIESSCVESRRFPCVESDSGVDACAGMKGVPDPDNWECKNATNSGSVPVYVCDAPDGNPGGFIDPFDGYLLESYSSSCVYRCAGPDSNTECAVNFGMPKGCRQGGSVCGNDGPSLDACMSDPSFEDFTDCKVRCRDADCQKVCLDITSNTTRCDESCGEAGATCESVCQALQREPKCDIVAGALQGQEKCETRCEHNFGPKMAGLCSKMCGAGVTQDACIDMCLDPEQGGIANAGFICLMSCSNGYNCQNNCIQEFGVSNYQCVCPGGNCANIGCAREPRWMYCPGTVTFNEGKPTWKDGPKVLDKDEADKRAVEWIQGKWMWPPDWDPEWRNLPTDNSLESKAMRKLMVETVFEHLFTCMTSLYMDQVDCGTQEQGLLAAWMALDKQGENADQAREFLRDDAYLLIIVISDEDDCSSPEGFPDRDGRWFNYAGQQDSTTACACMRDENGCLPSGECDYSKCLDSKNTFSREKCPLYSTSSLVNKLRSLKPDPAQVLFAAIVGDAAPGEGASPASAEVDDVRGRFFECRCAKGRDTITTSFNYVCSSDYGVAELGQRYIDAVNLFGSGRYGQLANVCSAGGVAPLLEQIAGFVVPLLGQICLPRPLEWDCQGRCENIFDDSAANCTQVCGVGVAECLKECNAVFEGRPGCAEVCRSAASIEIRKYNGDGTCAVELDEQGNCPILMETVGEVKGDFSLVRNSPMCPTFDVKNGERPENAIQFTYPLGYTDKLEITYRGGVDFCLNRCTRSTSSDAKDQEYCREICGGNTDDCLKGCLLGHDNCAYVCNVVVDDCVNSCNGFTSQCTGGTCSFNLTGAECVESCKAVE